MPVAGGLRRISGLCRFILRLIQPSADDREDLKWLPHVQRGFCGAGEGGGDGAVDVERFVGKVEQHTALDRKADVGVEQVGVLVYGGITEAGQISGRGDEGNGEVNWTDVTGEDWGAVDPGFGQPPEAFVAIDEADAGCEFSERLAIERVAAEFVEGQVGKSVVGSQ